MYVHAGLDLHSNAPERINREGTPVALGVEGQVVQVPQQGSRRQFIQEDSDEV